MSCCRGQAAIIFSSAIGFASRKVCIGVIAIHSALLKRGFVPRISIDRNEEVLARHLDAMPGIIEKADALAPGEAPPKWAIASSMLTTSWLSFAVRNPPIFPVFSTFCDAAKLPPKVSGKSHL